MKKINFKFKFKCKWKLSDKPWLVVLLHFLGAVALSVVLFFGVKIFLNVYTRHAEELEVPDFSNLTVSEAKALAEKHHMRVAVTDSVFLKRMKRGAVYRQIPSVGSKVKEDKLIALIINANKSKTVKMPDLVGLSTRQAKAELLTKGLVLSKLTYVQDLATNNVLQQLVKGKPVEPGTYVESETPVELVVGLNGYNNVTYVPDLIGLKHMAAVNALYDNSLNVNALYFDDTVKDYNDSLSAKVWRIVPEPSEVEGVCLGDEVALYLTLDQNKIPAKVK